MTPRAQLDHPRGHAQATLAVPVDALLYDPMPGGSGLLEQALARWDEVVEAARRVAADCPSACHTSCVDCLQTFRNQFYHKHLDRTLALERLDQWGSVLEKVHDLPARLPQPAPKGDRMPVNVAEARLRSMLLRAGFPEPRWQEPIDQGRPLGTTTPDAFYEDEDARICIYLDGLSKHIHGNPETAKRDREIRTELRNKGDIVIEIAASDLDDRAAVGRHFYTLGVYLLASRRPAASGTTRGGSRTERSTSREGPGVARHPAEEAAAMGSLLRPRPEPGPRWTPAEFLATTERVARVGSRPADLEPGLSTLERALKLQPDLVAARDGAGQTALHLAAFEGNEPLARLLLAHGAEAGARDAEGNTPLHLLMRRQVGSPPREPEPRRPESARPTRDFQHPTWSPPTTQAVDTLIRQLVAAGADLEAGDGHGHTPLQRAVLEDLPDRQQLLRSLGAREPHFDLPGVVELAARSGDPEQAWAHLARLPEGALQSWAARPLSEEDLLGLVMLAARLERGGRTEEARGMLRPLTAATLEKSFLLPRRPSVLEGLLAPLHLDGQREKADLVLGWFVDRADADGLCAAGDRLADRGVPELTAWFMDAVLRRADREGRPELLEPWGAEALPWLETWLGGRTQAGGAGAHRWGQVAAEAGIPWARLRSWLEAGRPLSLVACHALLHLAGTGLPPGWDRPSLQDLRQAFLAAEDPAPVFARARHVALNSGQFHAG